MCESYGRLQAQAQPTAQSELKQTNEQAALNTRADLFGGSALGRCNSTVSRNKLWLARNVFVMLVLARRALRL